MLMFYAEQPVDWLLVSYRQSMGQRRPLLRTPTLFQHFGVKSSFDTTRDNNLKDRCPPPPPSLVPLARRLHTVGWASARSSIRPVNIE